MPWPQGLCSCCGARRGDRRRPRAGHVPPAGQRAPARRGARQHRRVAVPRVRESHRQSWSAANGGRADEGIGGRSGECSVAGGASSPIGRERPAPRRPGGPTSRCTGCPAHGGRGLLGARDRRSDRPDGRRDSDVHLSSPDPAQGADLHARRGSAMNDHETFQLLAAREVHEPLSVTMLAALHPHLAGCPDCRALAAGMRGTRWTCGRCSRGLRSPTVSDGGSWTRRRDADISSLGSCSPSRRCSCSPSWPSPCSSEDRWTDATSQRGARHIARIAPFVVAQFLGLADGEREPVDISDATPVGPATLSGVYTYVVFGGPGRGVSIQAQVRGGVVNGAWSLWSVDGSGQASDATSGRVAPGCQRPRRVRLRSRR